MKYIDLFAGIGGFRIALDYYGHDCVFSSEWDKDAQCTYKENFGEKPEGDITKISASVIPSHDVLCAGFPCQPFSISGKQLGFDDVRGTLFYDIVRIVKYHQPKYLLLENVANIISHDNGNTLKTIEAVLDKSYYKVHRLILNASHFGVPQSRKRIYFVCIRKDLPNNNNFIFPQPTYEPISLKNITLSCNETKALIINRNDVVLDKKLINKYSNDKNLLKPIRIGFVNKGGQGERIYHENGHAITLSAYGGGAGAKTGLYFLNDNVRKLHPEECKRLMAFPDNFKINPNPYHAYKQFGNAIITKMVKLLVNNIMEQIECPQPKRTLKLEKTQRSDLRPF